MKQTNYRALWQMTLKCSYSSSGLCNLLAVDRALQAPAARGRLRPAGRPDPRRLPALAHLRHGMVGLPGLGGRGLLLPLRRLRLRALKIDAQHPFPTLIRPPIITLISMWAEIKGKVTVFLLNIGHCYHKRGDFWVKIKKACIFVMGESR